jgi:hypothetical protein
MFNALHLPSYRVPRKRDWPDGAFVRNKFGMVVLWWPTEKGGHHMSGQELEPYRQIGDPQLDKILDMFLLTEDRPIGPGDDILALMEQALQIDEASRTPVQRELASFLEAFKTVPSWVDVDQIRRGQEMFLAYTPACSLTLYYRSLIAGFSIPKIAAVIRSTGYLAPPSRPDQVMQRLLDTGELTASCIALGVEELLPDGIGWRTALHVRALHAKVRHTLLRRTGPRKWDVQKLGVPINQEDMASTLLAFSANVLVGLDFISGMVLSRQERLDYLALWRYIGWLLGVKTVSDAEPIALLSSSLPPLDPCGPGYGRSRDPILHSDAILQSVIFHILDPDETSVEIAHHLLKVSRNKAPATKDGEKPPKDLYLTDWFFFRSLQARRFVGNPLADALCLPLHPYFWKRVKLYTFSTIYLVLLRLYTLSAMFIPPLRRRMIRYHTNAMLRFHKNWINTHTSKMARALRRGEKASVSDQDDGEDNESENISCGKADSVCPFAMVAPPLQ